MNCSKRWRERKCGISYSHGHLQPLVHHRDGAGGYTERIVRIRQMMSCLVGWMRTWKGRRTFAPAFGSKYEGMPFPSSLPFHCLLFVE